MISLRHNFGITAVFFIALFFVACGDGEPEPTQDGPDRVIPAGCQGKCDGPSDIFTSPYKADVEVMNSIWSGSTPMETVEDAFVVEVDLGEAQFTAPTHLFGAPINVIPYADSDEVTDAAGEVMERGDRVISQAFAPGVIGLTVKHHRPSNRTMTPHDIESDIKEQVKLQDTHIGVVVGVMRDGEPGAITLNNPQSYEGGRFGSPSYPMIFLKPDWPDYLPSGLHWEFNHNTLLMLAGFNAVSNFPGDYNGGDPLAAHNVENLEEHTAMMVRAITGDEEAQEFFDDPANLVYCAELVFLGTSAGLHFPLNADTMVPLVGEEVWNDFVAEVEKHQSDEEESAFSSMNSNPLIDTVPLTLPSEELKPAFEYAPDPEKLQHKLAFEPMTMADIVQQFLRTHVPRQHLGEAMAPVQGQLLAAMKPGLLESMAMEDVPEEDPRRVAVDQLFDALVDVVSTPHESYEKFLANLSPLMEQARQVTGPRDDSGTGYFVPPSLYHVVAQGKHPGGLLGLEYLGHGIHVSATYREGDDSEQDEEQEEQEEQEWDPEPELHDRPYANSCQLSCGGQSPDESCWCDDVCQDYGDCCDDIADECTFDDDDTVEGDDTAQ